MSRVLRSSPFLKLGLSCTSFGICKLSVPISMTPKQRRVYFTQPPIRQPRSLVIAKIFFILRRWYYGNEGPRGGVGIRNFAYVGFPAFF